MNFIFCIFSAFSLLGHSGNRDRYIGIYQAGNSNKKEDTVSCNLILSRKSFDITFVIRKGDSNCVFPTYSGKWSVDKNEDTLTLNFDNGAILKGAIGLTNGDEAIGEYGFSINNLWVWKDTRY